MILIGKVLYVGEISLTNVTSNVNRPQCDMHVHKAQLGGHAKCGTVFMEAMREEVEIFWGNDAMLF